MAHASRLEYKSQVGRMPVAIVVPLPSLFDKMAALNARPDGPLEYRVKLFASLQEARRWVGGNDPIGAWCSARLQRSAPPVSSPLKTVRRGDPRPMEFQCHFPIPSCPACACR